eukprot:TRINITY_DN1979_c0_g1_i1.p1 TRINITY_DN1979_c0_g1~~TRINITY_DN1979_c0_g1_i1.p1  ORF type:complete len:564 (+),score=113.11 TRINITY_DN1979_c0_g1_i1:39-1730(+)
MDFESEPEVDVRSLPRANRGEDFDLDLATVGSGDGPADGAPVGAGGGATAPSGGKGKDRSGTQGGIPDKIRNFIVNFHKQVTQRNVEEIAVLYDSTFRKLTEAYYKQTSWPSSDQVSSLVNNDETFLLLYRELYYRNIYSTTTQPTIKQCFESWQNYNALFAFLLSEAGQDLKLPLQWQWDMVDEYIYHFQSFAQYRSKLKNKNVEEKELLKSNPQVWNIIGVLSHLNTFVVKSHSGVSAEKGADTTYSVQQSLGYFSAVGLLRLHCLLGDYHMGVAALKPINITNHKGLHTMVAACYITLYYYLGFAYLMMHHYSAAIKVFTNILSYINRTRQYHTHSYQYVQIMKKGKQTFTLLAISVALCPGKLTDGHIERRLYDMYGEKMQKIVQRKLSETGSHYQGDESVLAEMFFGSCPKFISPHVPDYSDESAVDYQHDARNLQYKVFVEDVRRLLSSMVPTLRSYLKLYTTIPLSKLATFLGVEPEVCRSYLLCYKNKTRSLAWTGGASLSTDFQPASDVSFYIDKDDMVHIADTKILRRYGEFFITETKKCQEICRRIDKALAY